MIPLASSTATLLTRRARCDDVDGRMDRGGGRGHERDRARGNSHTRVAAGPARAVPALAALAYLLPFAAGNFVYIAAADLLPEAATQPSTRDKLETSITFLTGLAILLLATQLP
jgi:hypothetical protein